MTRPESPVFHGAMKAFRDSLPAPEDLALDLIGKGAEVGGPFGKRKLVYADYVASGRALRRIEAFILDEVLPFYANSHTEASYCGAFVSGLRRDARAAIAESCGASGDHAVIFAGSGATAGLNRLVNLLGVGAGVRVVIGPYEHHSNILPWRESGADVVELGESSLGGPNMQQLDAALSAPGHDRVIVALSAASNVTGIVSDVEAITRRVKAAGALMVWDYAGGGPYLPIDICPAPDALIDAIVTSPHKFIGGPGASGVMILRKDAVVSTTPTWPGGGTVRFVSSQAHDYLTSIEAREEAGTPNVLGDIRAGLVFVVKQALGQAAMIARNGELVRKAMFCWSQVPQIELLGSLTAPRLPIFSMRLRKPDGTYLNAQLAARMLSDHFGIQARGGCACAGPYAHRLLAVSEAQSARLRGEILAGNEMEKPGFLRLNFSVLMSAPEVDFILESLATLARSAASLEKGYDFDTAAAVFVARAA